jgi:hypothetical protein
MMFAGWIANKRATEMPLATANIDTLSSRFAAPPLAVVPAGAVDVGSRQSPLPAWANEVAERLLSP